MSALHPSGQVRIKIERAFMPDEFYVGISLLNQAGLGKLALAEPIRFKEVDPDACGLISEPTIMLSRSTLAELAEGLWRLGFRPELAVDQRSVIDAQRAHIEDLQQSHRVVLDIARRQEGTVAGDGGAS